MSLLDRAAKSLRKNGLGGSLRYLGNELRMQRFRLRYRRAGRPALCLSRPAIDGLWESDADFCEEKTELKVFALYSEQEARTGLHSYWNAIALAKPRLAGHLLPKQPDEDWLSSQASLPQRLRAQVALAKSHGIAGFCFEEEPGANAPALAAFCKEGFDFPFCLCLQVGSSTPEEAFLFSEPYLRCTSYFRIWEKPLLLLRGVADSEWLSAFRDAAGDVCLWLCEAGALVEQSLQKVADGTVLLPPVDSGGKRRASGTWIPYETQCRALLSLAATSAIPVHLGCMPQFDNSVCKPNEYLVTYGYSARAFYDFVVRATEKTKSDVSNLEQVLFVNAFNDWFSGASLEPDARLGFHTINTFSRALFGLPYLKRPIRIEPKANVMLSGRLAVQVHLFYLDTLPSILKTLRAFPVAFDCFVSTDSFEKKERIASAFKEAGLSATIELFENRGRDVAPFLQQMRDRIENYRYICHLHSKRTVDTEFGDAWREALFWDLAGTPAHIAGVLSKLEQNPQLGLVFPAPYETLRDQIFWGCNREATVALLRKMNLPDVTTSTPIFPVGNMFFARVDAVKKLFDLPLKIKDFPPEKGQRDATLAHAIERVWVYMASAQHYDFAFIANQERNPANDRNK